MRQFAMFRAQDISGLSGEGIVAEVAEFADGSVAMRWLPTTSPTARARGVRPTTVMHHDLTSVLALHDHDGRTTLRQVLPDGGLGPHIDLATLTAVPEGY